MSEINLLSSQTPQVSSVNNGFLVRLFARIFLLLVILAGISYLVVLVVNYSTNKSLVTVQNKVKSAQAEALANKDRNELVTRQEQLKQLDTLVDSHVYWSYLLPELARVTLRSAVYSNISAKSDGKLNLDVTLPSYSEVEKFMQIFDLPEYNQQFSNVRIVSIDSVQNGTTIQIKLRLQLTFNPAYIKGRM
jgi:hypothetical protein